MNNLLHNPNPNLRRNATRVTNRNPGPAVFMISGMLLFGAASAEETGSSLARGAKGAYGSGKHHTGLSGVDGSAGADIDRIVSILTDKNPSIRRATWRRRSQRSGDVRICGPDQCG